jgi:hypothetical protein
MVCSVERGSWRQKLNRGKERVILFLRGFMSTDVGTFDLPIRQIEQQRSLADVQIVGWPHDMLAPIKVNAQDLAELIETRLGSSGLPLMFMCHLRGGLVARAPSWPNWATNC